MFREHFNPKAVQSGAHGRYLIQNVDTVLVLIDHPTYSGDLSRDPVEANF